MNKYLEHIYKSFEQFANVFFAIDSDYNFTYLNSQAEHFFSTSSSQLIGENIWTKTPINLQQYFYQA